VCRQRRADEEAARRARLVLPGILRGVSHTNKP
jgi:hypothetical protein